MNTRRIAAIHRERAEILARLVQLDEELAAAFVERIEGASPGGPGALDIVLEAPSLIGPFRLQVFDPVPGRDFRAQIGKLEKGRARLKGILEDKSLGSRVTLDGWFGVPGGSGLAKVEPPVFSRDRKSVV